MATGSRLPTRRARDAELDGPSRRSWRSCSACWPPTATCERTGSTSGSPTTTTRFAHGSPSSGPGASWAARACARRCVRAGIPTRPVSTSASVAAPGVAALAARAALHAHRPQAGPAARAQRRRPMRTRLPRGLLCRRRAEARQRRHGQDQQPGARAGSLLALPASQASRLRLRRAPRGQGLLPAQLAFARSASAPRASTCARTRRRFGGSCELEPDAPTMGLRPRDRERRLLRRRRRVVVHNSPRRGLEFVTRKITWHAAAIKLGLRDKL